MNYYAFDYIGVIVAQKKRLITPVISPPATGFEQIPTMTGTLREPAATEADIQAALAAAQPGDHVRVPFIEATSINWACPNGSTGGDPIAAYPSDKNNPPILRGPNNYLSGDNVRWFSFDVESVGTSSNTRSIRVENSDGSKFLYFSLEHDGQIPIELTGGVENCELAHFHWVGTSAGGGSIGGSALKAGLGGTGGDLRNNTLRDSLLVDINGQREIISIKEAGFSVIRVTATNCKDLVVRHGASATLELVRGFRYIVCQGPDHTIRDCLPDQRISVPPGSRDGDIASPYSAFVTGNGDIYYSAHDQLIENCPCLIIVGDNTQSFGDELEDTVRPDGTQIASITGTSITTPNGDSFTPVSASQAARTIPTIAAADCGIAGYLSHVTGAP